MVGACLAAGSVLADSGALPGESSANLPALPAPQPTDRILVVSPHPDDETIGAGGFIQEAVQVGAALRVVVATDGNKHGLKRIRHSEIINALTRLGVAAENVVFFDYPDGKLSRQPDFFSHLEQVSEAFRPNIVIGTHPKDFHPDHSAVGRAIDELGRESNHSLTAYFFVVHYHRYPLPDAYRPDLEEVPAPRLADPESKWATLSLTVPAELVKRDAVLEYHSQLTKRNPLKRGLLISFIRKSEVFAVRSY